MMKSMSSLLMLVILCGRIHLINGESLQCEFGDRSFFGYIGNFYSCFVTALENSNDNKVITEYNGVHIASKNDKDVKAIWIEYTNTKFIPEELGSVFNINILIIRGSKLVEIRSKDFLGMENLEYLSFYGNKLTSLQSDTFIMLPKLRVIDLRFNKIKYISSGVFDKLTNLNDVYYYDNICVDKDYERATAITQMKEDLKANCQNPNDVIQYEIEHKIRDESTRIRKESHEQFKALNEIVKQLLLEAKEYKMDHQENIKLRAELLTAKDGQKKEQDKNINVINDVTNERDQLMKDLTDLKKELSEAKETIEQKLPKMKQTIEDFYMEVMDLKIERHNERQNSIALRSKLMEANEQLAECQINERISC